MNTYQYILYALLSALVSLPMQGSPTPPSWAAYLKNYVPKKQHRFVVIIPSYNNKQWYAKNLDSILSQAETYPHFRAIYLDDASRDGTGELVCEYLSLHDKDKRVTLIQNKHNIGGLGNIYTACHMCEDDEICVEMDGDDWFASNNALCILNKVYNYTNPLITYGQYQDWPSGRPSWRKEIPPHYISHHNYRGNWGWIAPCRSWYAWLFKKIKKSDLLVNEPSHKAHGKFFPVSWDHAMMWPMCEMANKRIQFVPDILYIYNRVNPISDSKQSSEQYSFVDYLCDKKRTRYAPLSIQEIEQFLCAQP